MRVIKLQIRISILLLKKKLERLPAYNWYTPVAIITINANNLAYVNISWTRVAHLTSQQLMNVNNTGKTINNTEFGHGRLFPTGFHVCTAERAYSLCVHRGHALLNRFGTIFRIVGHDRRDKYNRNDDARRIINVYYANYYAKTFGRRLFSYVHYIGTNIFTSGRYWSGSRKIYSSFCF